MIGIIDYGLGNIQAFINAYKKLHIPVVIAKTPADLANVDQIILPGVGSFDYAMKLFSKSGLRDITEKKVLEDKVPILGICVGMQMLAESSSEGEEQGLGWIRGQVLSFSDRDQSIQVPIPHMGWNDVKPNIDSDVFSGIADDPKFYFLHSYYFSCDDPKNSIATSNYGNVFSVAIQSENIIGVQFHPEKSHYYGSQLLKNFATISLC